MQKLLKNWISSIFIILPIQKMKKKLLILFVAIIIIVWVFFLITKWGIFQKESISDTMVNNISTTVEHKWQLTFQIVWPEEEPKEEKRSYAPAEIKTIVQESWTTILTLDMLTMNPNFQPGVNDFFINQNPKLRDIAISNETKAFNCGNDNKPDVSVSLETIIAYIQQRLTDTTNWPITYYFDIADGKINTIYQQCLP